MNETAKSYISCDIVRMSPDNIVTVSGQVQKFFKLIVTLLLLLLLLLLYYYIINFFN